MEDTIIYFGGEVKALGDGKVAGQLVTFGNEKNHDLSSKKDFFNDETDFDVDFNETVKSTVYYNHGIDKNLGKKKLGNGVKGVLSRNNVGIWVEAQLDMRDEYEASIYAMVAEGKMGWSSGTAAHMVDREKKGAAHFIKRWPLGLDASITPTPAEYRNKAVAIKSICTLTEWEAELKSITEKEELKKEQDFITGEGLSLSKHIKSVALQVEILTERMENSDSMKIGAAIGKHNKQALSSIADNLLQHSQQITAMISKESANDNDADEKSLKELEAKQLEELELQNLQLQETEFIY